MIIECSGDMFRGPGNHFVIPVNSVGVMGNGLACHFKNSHPESEEIYRKACRNKSILKKGFIVYQMPNGKVAILLTTKYHWRDNAVPELIDKALSNLRLYCEENSVGRINFPAIGCGKGNLDWETEVYPLIKKNFETAKMTVACYV